MTTSVVGASSRLLAINATGSPRRNRTTASAAARRRDHTTTINVAIGTRRRNHTIATSNNYNVNAAIDPNSYDAKKRNHCDVKSAANTWTTPDLLIIDELGYLGFDARGADLLYQVINRRYQRASTIITTNLPFKDWGGFKR